MAEYHVVVPTEKFAVIEFTQKRLPGVGVINSALRAFEPKIVFAWHLSIMLQFQDLTERGMPTREEKATVDLYGAYLDRKLKGGRKKPNGLFLARLTWNGTRELIYRIYDPEAADTFLKKEIASKKCARDFDYCIDRDRKWKLASWHLGAIKKKTASQGCSGASPLPQIG